MEHDKCCEVRPYEFAILIGAHYLQLKTKTQRQTNECTNYSVLLNIQWECLLAPLHPFPKLTQALLCIGRASHWIDVCSLLFFLDYQLASVLSVLTTKKELFLEKAKTFTQINFIDTKFPQQLVMTLNYRVLIKGSTFLASHICIIVLREILNIMYKYHSFHNPSVIQYYTHASDVPLLFEFLFLQLLSYSISFTSTSMILSL